MKKTLIFFIIICFYNFLCAETYKSYYEKKYELIEKQENYYSCGLSIIKCLLNFFDKENISQSNIMSLIINNASTLQTKGGISMLDMKNFLELYNIKSFGIFTEKQDIDNVIEKFNCVTVIHYKEQTQVYKGNEIYCGHFVILLYSNIEKNIYIVLDPNLGLMRVGRNYINKYFSGYCLLIPELIIDKDNVVLQEILKEEENYQLLKNRKGLIK